MNNLTAFLTEQAENDSKPYAFDYVYECVSAFPSDGHLRCNPATCIDAAMLTLDVRRVYARD